MSDTGTMKPDDATVPVAEPLGWFGKIPALGDFATRHLPRSFVDRWDEWLCGELGQSQRALGDDWAPVYRQSPVWCFSLGAGVVDERAWQGILLPSFDRVGREFPLTIAQRWPGRLLLGMPDSGWAELVAIGQGALDRKLSADALDAALASFASPRGAFPATSAGGVPGGAASERTAVGVGTSSWWPWRADIAPAAPPLSFSGLPRGSQFRPLLGS